MAKDAIGNIIKVNDKILFNNLIFTVKEIDENRVIGGKTMTARGITGMKIPDNITLEIDLPFDADKPFNGFILKNPEEKDSNSN